MARRTWTPDRANNDQLAALKEVDNAAGDYDRAEERLWKAIETARRLKIPANFLAERIGKGRATLYRKIKGVKASDE